MKSAVANALAQSQTIIRLTERKMTVPGADPPPRTVYDGVLSSDSICSDEMRRILSDSSFFTAREKDMQTFAELKLEKMQKIETAKAALLLLPPESPQAKTPPMSAKATPHPGSLSVDNSPVHKNKEPFNPNPTAETKLSLDMIKSLQKIVFDSSDDEKEGASSTSHGGSESETERQTKRIRRKKRRKVELSCSYFCVEANRMFLEHSRNVQEWKTGSSSAQTIDYSPRYFFTISC